MKMSHRGLGIDERDWQVFLGHVNATLDHFKVAAREKFESQDFELLSSGDLEVVERGVHVAQEDLPVALIDPKPAMRHLHVAPHVVDRTASARPHKIGKQLPLAA